MKKLFTLTTIASSLLLANASAFAQSNTQSDVENTPSNSISHIDINSPQSKNAVLLDSATYHVNQKQPKVLTDNDVKYELKNDNSSLTLSLIALNSGNPVESFNLKNLPGINGQIHALWLSNDFKKGNNRTLNIEGHSVDNIKLNIPKEFRTQKVGQCDAIFISYQLQHTSSPNNIIRFAKVEQDDNKDVLKIYETPPSGCKFVAPDVQNTMTVTKNDYIVNMSFNPNKMKSKSVLDVTIHATKEGKEHFLPNVETVLIKKDLTGLNFLIPSAPKHAKSPISAWHGSGYSANISEAGEYIIGVGLEEGKKREWVFNTSKIK